MPKTAGFTQVADDSAESITVKASRLKKHERLYLSAHARSQRASLRKVRDARQTQIEGLLTRAETTTSVHHGRKIVLQAKKIASQSGLRITLTQVDDHLERQVQRPGNARRTVQAQSLTTKQIRKLLVEANNNPGNCRHLLDQADQLVANSDYEIILVEVPGKIGFQRELAKRRAANSSRYAVAA